MKVTIYFNESYKRVNELPLKKECTKVIQKVNKIERYFHCGEYFLRLTDKEDRFIDSFYVDKIEKILVEEE